MCLSKTRQTSQFLLSPPLESAGLFLPPPAINQNLNGTLPQLQLQVQAKHKVLHSARQGFQIRAGLRCQRKERQHTGYWAHTLYPLLVQPRLADITPIIKSSAITKTREPRLLHYTFNKTSHLPQWDGPCSQQHVVAIATAWQTQSRDPFTPSWIN